MTRRCHLDRTPYTCHLDRTPYTCHLDRAKRRETPNRFLLTVEMTKQYHHNSTTPPREIKRTTTMQHEIQPAQSIDDEIDLRELATVLWAGKKLIVSITALFAIIALIVVVQIPNQYKATAVVSPSQKGGSSVLSTMASQFGGLASLGRHKSPLRRRQRNRSRHGNNAILELYQRIYPK